MYIYFILLQTSIEYKVLFVNFMKKCNFFFGFLGKEKENKCLFAARCHAKCVHPKVGVEHLYLTVSPDGVLRLGKNIHPRHWRWTQPAKHQFISLTSRHHAQKKSPKFSNMTIE